ncbi:MAG TPA: AraC family transcriptional regulator [Candidatus Acidoferrum sp.]
MTHFAQRAKSVVPRHYHDTATLCALLQGNARDHFRYRTIEFEPGSVIYRPPGEGHSHEFGQDGMVAIVIEIPSSRLDDDPALRFLSELRFEQNVPMLANVAQLLGSLRNSATAEADLEEHCFSFLTVFNRVGEEASGSAGLDRVRKLLDECSTEKQSLSELGAIAELHPAYLVNAFRKRFGCSIGQYRRRRRLELAIKQIWNTRLPLSEIALETGFYDQSHCTNEMRRHLQLTPAQIRGIMARDL